MPTETTLTYYGAPTPRSTGPHPDPQAAALADCVIGEVCPTCGALPCDQATTLLWCVRLEGPDDVIAQASREAADAYAEQHHAMVKRLIARNPGTEEDGITEASMRAIVEPWPWSAEAHAKALMEDADVE